VNKRKSTWLLLGLAYLAFISLGLPDGLLGVAWPSIRASFHLRLDALGSLLLMFTGGYLLSSFNSGRLLAHMNVGALLALSCLATAASLLGYGLAPHWWVMVVLGLLSGLGAGAIDAGLNTYAALHFTTRTVNWLHGFYGLGATLGPLIMTCGITGGHPWQWGYWVVGTGQLGLALCFAATRSGWLETQISNRVDRLAEVEPASTSNTLRLPVVWLSLAIFFAYTGLEASAGTWAYSLFVEGRRISAMTAGIWVSAYYGSLTAGRFLSGMVAGWISVTLLLRLGFCGIVAGAALIWLNTAVWANFLGLASMGLSSAPVFPSLIATTPARLGKVHTANGVGFQIAAACLGPAVLPSLLGVLASKFGLEVIGPTLLVMGVLALALHEGLVAASVPPVCNPEDASEQPPHPA
jgi:fucose permease